MTVCDDRGTSSTLSYALNLAVAGLLVTTVLYAGGTVVENRRESAARAELQVVGQRLAASVASTDRLRATGASTVRQTVELPARVAGLDYTVTVDGDPADPKLVLETDDPDVRVTVPLTVEDLDDATVRGGDLVVVLADDGSLEVRSK